jgi:hypothetical protein
VFKGVFNPPQCELDHTTSSYSKSIAHNWNPRTGCSYWNYPVLKIQVKMSRLTISDTTSLVHNYYNNWSSKRRENTEILVTEQKIGNHSVSPDQHIKQMRNFRKPLSFLHMKGFILCHWNLVLLSTSFGRLKKVVIICTTYFDNGILWILSTEFSCMSYNSVKKQILFF